MYTQIARNPQTTWQHTKQSTYEWAVACLSNLAAAVARPKQAAQLLCDEPSDDD